MIGDHLETGMIGLLSAHSTLHPRKKNSFASPCVKFSHVYHLIKSSFVITVSDHRLG